MRRAREKPDPRGRRERGAKQRVEGGGGDQREGTCRGKIKKDKAKGLERQREREKEKDGQTGLKA